MKYIDCLFFLVAAILFSVPVLAQCDFEPEIEGDLILCPESEGELRTGSYDEYQWYQRSFSGSDEAQPIPGATDSFLVVNHFDFTPSWISVEVVKDTCVVRSEEVLLDGYAFIPPFVETVGDFAIGPNGETIICRGDSLLYVFSMDKNIQWYRNGEPIDGATEAELIVTEGGSYFAEGAPEECPEFIMTLGVTLEVDKRDVDPTVPDLELVGFSYDTLTLQNPEDFIAWDWYCESLSELTFLTSGDTTLVGFEDAPDCSIGPFFIQGLDRNGCIEWSEPVHTIISNVEENSLGLDRVYPNPATDRLLLEFPEDPGSVQYRLLNVGGQLVQKGELPAGQSKQLDIGNLPAGNYFVELSADGLRSVVQIVKVE